MEATYYVLPLVDKGFIDRSEDNPSRWYIETPEGKLLGPYADMKSADDAAYLLNGGKA